MDDFKKQAEAAKLARMQGIRIRPDTSRAPSENRIEEALGRAEYRPAPATQLPHLSKPTPAVAPAVMQQAEKPVQRSGYARFLKKFFFGLALVTLIGGVGLGGYAVFKVRVQKPASTDQIIEAVGKLTELPAGQKPTVATVTDLKPLEGQAFFQDAQVGDKVLVFGDTRKAILYRPSTNKIVQIAPLDQ